MDDPSLISVVMPVWNRADTIEEAIRSVLAQTWTSFELIVVDDESTDGTADLIRAFASADERIRPLWLTHGGGPRAMNAALQVARGRYVARLDADDVAVPDRLHRQWTWMQGSAAAVCGGQAELFGESTGRLWFPESHEAIGRELIFRIGMLHSTLMARTAVLRTEGYREDTGHDDYEMLTRLHGRHGMANLPDVLAHHRVHPEQSSQIDHEQFRGDLRRYRFAFVYRQYPNTPARSYAILAALAERSVFHDLPDLLHAGQWLVRLADHPDPRLRDRMARRWDDACTASASTGLKPVAELSAIRAGILGARRATS